MGERWLIHRKSIETLLIWANMESETLSEKRDGQKEMTLLEKYISLQL